MKEFILEMQEQWKKNPLLLLTEILGTVMGIMAALLISVLTIKTPFLLAYGLFLVASILLSFTAIKQRNSRLLLLNGVYTIINLIGVYNGILLLL